MLMGITAIHSSEVLVKEGYGYGPNPVEGWVRSDVGSYFPSDPKVNITQVFQERAIVPHSGKYLRHVA